MSRLEEEMQKSRVVVTGMGAITPIGLTVEEFWENVKAQKVGIGAITKFDTTDFKVKLAAEVKDFDAQAYMDFKQAKRMELFSQYAVAAAGQAIKDAGLEQKRRLNRRDWIWKKKTHTASERLSVPESAA